VNLSEKEVGVFKVLDYLGSNDDIEGITVEG
jgi:hypothetical protein